MRKVASPAAIKATASRDGTGPPKLSPCSSATRQRLSAFRARDARADSYAAVHGGEKPRDKRATQADAGGAEDPDLRPRDARGHDQTVDEATRPGHEVSSERSVLHRQVRVSAGAFI